MALSQAELQKKANELQAAKLASYTNVRTNDAGQTIATTPTGGTVVVSSGPKISGNLNDPTSFTARKTVVDNGQLKQVSSTPTAQEMASVTANLSPASTASNIGIATTSTGATTGTDLQQQLLDAQRNATLASLDKARNESLRALSQEEAQVQPQFAEQRSQARATSQRGAQSFAEFMAQRGLASSGASALGETQRLGALQGTLGGLQRQEQQTLADIASRRSGLESAYQSDLAATEANLQAQALQNAIAQQQAQEQAQAQATALQREQFMQTAGQYAGDYQAQINKVLGDNDPTNDWQADILGALRQEKIASLGLNQMGQPLPGANLPSYPQALEAYRMGIRSPEVMQVLNASGFTVPTGVSSGVSGTVQPTLQDTGLAGNITGYQDMMALLNLGKATGIDPVTKQPTYEPTDAMQKIRQIQNDYSGFARRFGESVVEDIVEELAIQAGIVADPNATKENAPVVEEDTSIGTTTDQRRMIDTFKDADGNLDTIGQNKARDYILQQFDSGLINEATALYLMDLYQIPSFE